MLRLPPPRSHPAAVRRVLVVDDCAPFRGLLTWYLSSVPGIEIVAEASDGLEALETARACRPELVFMDVRMPNMDGLEASRRMRAEGTPARIVLLSVEALSVSGAAFVESGADALIEKNALGERLGSLLDVPVAAIMPAGNGSGES